MSQYPCSRFVITKSMTSTEVRRQKWKTESKDFVCEEKKEGKDYVLNMHLARLIV